MKTPYPKLPELLREAGKIFETTPDNRYLDEMIADGKCDYTQFKLNQKIIFGAWKRGDKPESQSLDRKIRDFGDLLLREYIAFINGPSVAGFDRRQTVPMLLEVFLAPRLIDFLRPWLRDCTEMELVHLLAHDHPVAFAFEWIQFKYPQAWTDYEAARYQVYAGRDDTLVGWKNGDHVPKFSNLLGLLDDFIKRAELGEKDALQIRELFYVARTLAALFKVTSSYDFHAMVRDRLFNSERVIDPIQRLQAHCEGNLYSVMKQVEPLCLLNNEISKRLLFCEDRSAKAALDIDEQLVKAESLCVDLESLNVMWWRTVRLRAAWFVCSGRIEEARKKYRRLFDFVFYVGMEDLDRIYSEALVFAAVCGDHVFLRELKNLGMLFGRYAEPITAERSKASRKHKTVEIEDWEVVNWANTFGQLFPSSLFFDGVKPITSGTPLKSGLLSWGPDEMSLTIKDWRDPLKQLKNVGGKRITALMYFISLGKIHEVHELIAMGADVNILSSSNDSALLMAIHHASPMEIGPTDKSFFDELSALDHDKDVLNTPVDKRKSTVLGSAVEAGNPAIVKRVLEMGANANQRCDVDQVSPLFKAVYAFTGVPSFDEFLSELKKGSPELMESIRRHAPGLAGVDFASLPKNFDHLRDNPRHQKFGKEIFEYFQNQHATIRDEDRYQIISMLLKYGADPNEPHNIKGWKGYTPLMLAITQGRPDVVAEMLRKGNPIQVKLNQKAARPDGLQFDAKKLALVYQSQAVLDLLRGAGNSSVGVNG